MGRLCTFVPLQVWELAPWARLCSFVRSNPLSVFFFLLWVGAKGKSMRVPWSCSKAVIKHYTPQSHLQHWGWKKIFLYCIDFCLWVCVSVCVCARVFTPWIAYHKSVFLFQLHCTPHPFDFSISAHTFISCLNRFKHPYSYTDTHAWTRRSPPPFILWIPVIILHEVGATRVGSSYPV